MDKIVDHYKLTEDHISQQISDAHLDEVAQFCLDWRKLTSHLKMQTSIVADIERDHVKQEERRCEFFRTWKQQNGFDATYKILIGALLERERRDDAERVCKLLKTSLTQHAPVTPPQPSEQAPVTPPQPSEQAPVTPPQPSEQAPVTLPEPSEQKQAKADVPAKASGAVDPAGIIQNNYYNLHRKLAQHLEPLAEKLFSLGVANINSVASAEQPKKKRASALLDAIIINVKSNGKCFDTLVAALHDIPELSFLGDELETAQKIQVAERKVIMIHPTQVFNRGISSPATFNSEKAQQETASSASDFEEGFPTVMKRFGMALVVDDNPPFDASDRGKSMMGFTKPPLTPVSSDPALPAIPPSLTYSSSAIPIPGVAHYDETQYEGIMQIGKEESGNSCVQEKGPPKSEESYAEQVMKVQKLKTQPGYIVSQTDSEIAAKIREYERMSRRVEEAMKAKFESESEQLQDEQDDQSLVEMERELRIMFKDLYERKKKREENEEKFKDYLEQNSVQKIEQEEDATETAMGTPAQPNEPDESKLNETPSLIEALKVMFEHGMAATWRSIGTFLGVSPRQLGDIESITGSDHDSLQKVIYVWLNSPEEYCTWKYLIKAVKIIDRERASEMKECVLNKI